MLTLYVGQWFLNLIWAFLLMFCYFYFIVSICIMIYSYSIVVNFTFTTKKTEKNFSPHYRSGLVLIWFLVWTSSCSMSTVNLRHFIGCAVREFTFQAKKPGCGGLHITTDACWGRCETWEVSERGGRGLWDLGGERGGRKVLIQTGPGFLKLQEKYELIIAAQPEQLMLQIILSSG